MFYRNTWMEVRLDRIRDNISLLKQNTGKEFIAVIKANGYGIGDEIVAKEALSAGSAYLAVSSMDEALALRNKNILAPILVLGYADPDHAEFALENDITLTSVSLEWMKEVVKREVAGLKIHLKVDTGMNRIGSKSISELKEILDLILQYNLTAEGIYTHYACSDCEDNKMAQEQFQCFKQAVEALQYPFRWIHCANSDATVHFHEDFTNAVRCGIAMMGVTSYQTELSPVLSLYSKLVLVKQCPAGEPVSYGSTYHTSEGEWIGTVPIGYADGWIRKHQGRCCVVEGHECEFVGRVCMDQLMIRLPFEVPTGTSVELIGPNMPIERAARELDTIPYEIMTLLSDRITKVFYDKEQCISVSNPRFQQ